MVRAEQNPDLCLGPITVLTFWADLSHCHAYMSNIKTYQLYLEEKHYVPR